MKILVNERLSKNKMKTSEGYLICTDAILARTGKQQYRKSELWQDCGDDADEIVDIDRPYEEVFSEATLASFENKPITVEHPDVDVNTSNYKDYAVGFVRDVHQGKVDGQDVILGTLVITDQQTIEEIENGEHTDLSCGYDCDIVDENNPRQTNIRGNHVALCQQGRAGIARIVDSANVDDANKDVNQIIKYFEVWGYPVGKELQEAVDFYKLSKKDVEKIFGPRIGRTYDRFELTKLRTYDEAVVKDVVNDSIKDDALEDFFDLLDDNNIDYDFISGGYGIEFRNNYSYTKAKELAKKVRLIKGVWDDRKLTYHNFSSTSIGQDSIQDVEPRTGESEEDFIKRFMSETKNEYPDHQQRLAVAYSYWRNRNMKDTIKDASSKRPFTYRGVYVEYNEETHKWIDSDGNKYMGYLEPKDIKYYIDRSFRDSIEDTIKDAEFTLNKDEKLNYKGHTLYRVYYDSTKGGWAESERNIEGYAKVLDEAKVYGNAIIKKAATISGQAEVYDYATVSVARVSDNAKVYGNAVISGGNVLDKAEVYGNAEIKGSAKISGQANVYGNAVIENNAEVSGQAEVYGYANVVEWGEVSDNAKVYGNAEIKDSGKVENNAKVYGSATISGGVATDNAEVYGNAKVQGTVKDNAKVCGNAEISNFSEISGRAIVDENANIISSKIYGNAQIYGNATVGHSKIFGNAMVKDYAKVEKAEIQGMTVVKGNMKVSNIKISSNKDLENAGIKDSVEDSTTKDAYIDLDFDGDESDARKLANRYGCQYKRNGSANGYPIFRFTGPRDKLQKLCKTYGMDKDDFNYYVEDSEIAVKDSTGEQFDILKVPGDGFVYLQSRFDKRLVKSYEDNFKTKYTVKKV